MLIVPYRPIQLPFLSGRLGVMGVPCRPVGSLPHKTDIGIELYGQILHIYLCPRDGFQCFTCFTCPILLSNAAVPQWSVESNGVFLSGRLGVSHIMHIYQERIICPEITHQGPQTWFSMFNVPYRPIQLSFLSCQLGVMGIPRWPVGSLPHKTDIGIELYGQITHYTSRPPEMVFNVWRVSRAPHIAVKCCRSSAAGWVMGCSSVAGWEYHT